MDTTRTTLAADRIAGECLAVRLRTLNRAVTKLYDDALRPLGLKASQLNILVAAAKAGVARPLAICRALAMDASTLSRNVERMRARGWIDVVEGEDARTQPFRLTDKGRRLLTRAVPAWERAQARARVVLGPDGAAWLHDAAKRVRR